ncbi:AAA family ATPase, partial [Jatrophihabitans sp. YIM 134969]
MTSDVGVFGADHPEAYIPGDRRRALRDGRELPDRADGAALFADISGFTPLTEGLVAAYGPRRGAEELSAALEVVFGAVLGELHRHTGAVIYFSGDAVTCWLDGDDGTLAVAAGLAMQAAVVRSGTLTLPGGGTAVLGMKVAVAAGRARRYVVGDPRVQLIDVLAGRLMDTLAEVEATAGRGEVVVATATVDALPGRFVTGERRAGGVVVTGLTAPVDVPPLRERVEGLPEAVTRQWLLPAVYERMRAGRGDFLTELRPAVPVFVHFTGIDHDDDPDAPARLDEFVRAVQHVVDGYGGNLLQLTIGDKGAYLYLVFGAPVAHEDDPARACAAALDLLPLVRTTAARDLRIGVARGSTRAGTNGHRYRRTFTCLGDPVNLAARLMSKAPAGEVYVSEAVAAATGGRFGWEPLPPLTLKGKAEPAPARRLVAHRRGGGVVHARRDRPMIGREDVLADIRGLVQQATVGRGRVVGITGEAGLGKSRLIAEVLAGIDRDRVTVAVGEAQTFGVPTAYSAWRGIALDLFGLAPNADAATQLATFTAAVRSLDPALAARAPLLGALTGTDLPENDLTAAMTPELRKGSLELLVAQLLQRRGRTRPLALVLEDAHALDPLAADLLEVVVRRVATLPVLVLLAYRPFDVAGAPPWHDTLLASSHAHEVVLSELSGAAAEELVDVTVRRVFDLEGEVPDALRRTVLTRTQGNPFHVEELVAFVRARGVDVTDAAALAAVDLPDSLESLVLSRIDALPEQPRRTAKVASVVGRTFDAATVDAAAPDLERLVAPSVLVLTERDLVVPEPHAADRLVPDWAFRHVVVRDVAYDSLPWAVRTELHDRIADHLEAVAGADGDSPRVLDLLAHHRWHGRDDDRKRDVLARAGAAARVTGANAVAAFHLERLLTLVDDDAAPAVLVDLGQAQELAGAWDAARVTHSRALELAEAGGRRAA